MKFKLQNNEEIEISSARIVSTDEKTAWTRPKKGGIVKAEKVDHIEFRLADEHEMFLTLYRQWDVWKVGAVRHKKRHLERRPCPHCKEVVTSPKACKGFKEAENELFLAVSQEREIRIKAALRFKHLNLNEKKGEQA